MYFGFMPWRKLMINCLIILICGIATISIPVIVNYQQKSTSAANNQPKITLVCEFVGNQYTDESDSGLIWQIYQQSGDTVVMSWNEIYSVLSIKNTLKYDQENLILSSEGLTFRGIHSTDDYQTLYNSQYCSSITFQGQTCLLTLP